MSYPILAASNTWWKPNVSTITRASITEIEIKDSYIPDSSMTIKDSWDASEAKDGSITCYVIGTKLIIAGNGSGKIAANADSSYCFGNSKGDFFSSITIFTGTNLFDTSNITNMSYMFCQCAALTSLDVSSWDVSNVVDMQFALSLCKKLKTINGLSNWNVSNVENMRALLANSMLTSLDLSGWNTSKVTAMQQMFAYCQALTTITGLADWNTSNVTDLSNLFNNCNNLISCDIENWNTINVTTIGGMFFKCNNLTSLNLSNWNTANIEIMDDVFSNCTSLVSLGDLSNWNMSKVKTTAALFNRCHKLTTLGNLDNWDMSNVTNMFSMFGGCVSLISIGNISNWDTSSVTDMGLMFDTCRVLSNIGDISNWDVSSVMSMRAMFQQCNKLTGIGNLANWNPSACTDMSFMFYSCSSIGEIDVSNWNTSKLTNLDHFAAHAGLRRKGIEKWNTSSLVNANAAFHNCAEEELDFSGWDVSKVQFFCQMFENSPNLKHIKGLDKWDTSSAVGFDEMFGRCPKLEELNLSSWDTSKAKNGVKASMNDHTTGTFRNFCNDCQNLKWIKLGPNFSINGDGTNTNPEYKLILPTPSTDYIEGADGNWYTYTGVSYAPNAIPDRTYNTYYASKDLIHDLPIRINNGTILDIIEAVREKVPNLEPTLLSDLDDIIRNI